MKTSDFWYDLPHELIAQTPCERRDGSRMLALSRESGEVVHTAFERLTDYLRAGDCLVFNDSRVIPARLLGERENGGAAELLLLRQTEGDCWECLAKPGRRLRVGAEVSFGGGILKARIEGDLGEGMKLVRFFYEGIWQEILLKLGEMPLPPYITERLSDPERYQTVYSKHEGSAAAPTAGLHFTPEMLEKVRAMGVDTAFVTLHVGLGTFRPVKVEDVNEHKMHSEYYVVTAEAADKINAARARGGRVIAVGTTSCRVLETVADEKGLIRPCSGNTEIFIYPGYTFKCMDGLLTNFHLPESTLLMLVSAFAGKENIMNAYQKAVAERYRFFSFGDCMLIF
ncbi:MAG: tRNA preQ1(34) S-adenosylmethionine ribosyltransferase-isomerase QueA [Clostridia bacterium]|nr:tRNA preQ1(34) S-adenosylmethionine ribosyltransferase-isomerase QueA [Clostridia bacterium]